MAVVLVLLGLVGVWVWQNAAQRQAVRDLPTQDRLAMFGRTLESVRSVCVPARSGLEGYCRSQATLLLEFPECDADCVGLVHRARGEPTR